MKIAAVVALLSFAEPSRAAGLRSPVSREAARRESDAAPAAPAAPAEGGVGSGEADEEGRQLQSGCWDNNQVAKWHPKYSEGSTDGYCTLTIDCDSPGFSTQLACCKGSYPDQMSGACLNRLPSPPTTRGTVGLFDIFSAEDKESDIMRKVQDTRGERGKYPNAFQFLCFVLFENINPTMSHDSDTLYYNHGKRIHSVGFTGSIAFESVGDHPYTGLFKGAPYGLIRMGLATPPFGGMIPGLGVKFFRDGLPSANFVAMYKLDGQRSGNFFENDFSNHIPETNNLFLLPAVRKFERASSPAERVGLSDIARANVDGTLVAMDDMEYPFQLILKPNETLRETFQGMSPLTDLAETFDQIPIGTVLYEIHARSAPEADPILIGQLKTKSELKDSSYGDNHLFFKHQPFTDDLVKHPEWASARRTNEEGKCPFGF